MALRQRDRELNRKMFKQIGKLKLALDEEYKQTFPLDFSKINALEAELDKLLEDEEIYWKQPLGENWLKRGDKNTKWFHRRASIWR